MSTEASSDAGASLTTRREFLTHIAASGALVAVAPCVSLARVPAAIQSPATSVATPVVSFLMDAPYLDVTGTAVPYRPPVGLRSGEPLAALSDAEYYCLYGK
jgi:hypothetical protein